MKILITILLALFISNSASAGDLDIEIIDDYQIEPSNNTSYANLTTVCIDGYKFLTLVHQAYHPGITERGQWTATRSIDQFYIEKDGRSVPAKC
tara:strand:+ start:704 stop:985 length:282 start_codon:yes stop_codon:yes gene_type:complete